ncbi:MAG: HD domain-containing protein [Flavobacteriia bacterium]|nr:HD domain-containing protein [Flavobacteriia bacterium]
MDINKIIIENVKELVKTQFQTDATGHDWFHIERVYNMACFLHEKEGGDRELIEISALLHDISDHKFNGGSPTKGGDIAFEILVSMGYNIEKAQKIKEIINQISYKGALVSDQTNSLEAQIVQDADRLDALGAIGIARAFAYGGNRNREIYNPSIPPVMHETFEAYKNSKNHTINHFHEKLLLLTSKLHTNTAKTIGLKRHSILENFLNDFLNEWNFIK